MSKILSPKDPSEVRTITFRYGREFPGATITAPVITVTVSVGSDATPQAIKSGAAQVQGQNVLQAFQAGTAWVDYHLACAAMVNGAGPVIRTAILPVRSL